MGTCCIKFRDFNSLTKIVSPIPLIFFIWERQTKTLANRKRFALKIFTSFQSRISWFSSEELSISLALLSFRSKIQVFSKKKSPHLESVSNFTIFVPKNDALQKRVLASNMSQILSFLALKHSLL